MQGTANDKTAANHRKVAVVSAVVLLLALVSVVAFKNWQAKECRSQVVRMEAAALEFPTDTGRGLPTTLDQLCPKYLPSVPNCPTAGWNTYEISPYEAGLIRCSQQAVHDRWLLYPRSHQEQ